MRRRGLAVAADEAPCKDFMDAYRRFKDYVWRGVDRPGVGSHAPDLFQKVWVRVDQRIRAGTIPHPMTTVLACLIEDELRNHYKTEGRRRIAGEPDDDAVPTSKPGPELLYARAEDAAFARELVDATVAELEPHEQEALNLVDFDESSPEEAALVIGCSDGTLAARLHRARNKFVKVGRRMALLLQRERKRR